MAGNRIFSRCIYCNNTFTSKLALDDHIVKKHPDFITAVSKKVHECTKCPYKTVITSHLKEHTLAKHPDITGTRVTSTCIYCNKTFVRKQTLDDHIVKSHPDFISSVSRKVHECTKCTYKTAITSYLKEHIMVNHPGRTFNCIYCDKTFTTKLALDDHIVKIHPDFITSVSRTVHECTKCAYKTVSTHHLKKHIIVNHPDIGDNRVTSTCIYCDKTFVRKETLDEHILKTHPDFIASVSRKVHECTECTFKTISNSQFRRHMVTHSAGNRVTITCIYCNKTFIRKDSLEDHIVKKHPEFIASVSAKVHECTKCTYKTVNTIHLKRHIKANHPDIADNSTTKRCIHCNRTFASKQTLDDHIVKRHPDFITSVSGKVHECTKCTYKTANTTHLKEHILANHLDITVNRVSSRCIYCNKTFVRKETLEDHIVKTHPHFIAFVSNRVTSTCIYCNKTFVRKETLDDHVVKRHPDFIASVSRKVHQCTKCTYKTVSINRLKEHMMINHPNRMFKCIHCNKTFASKQALDGHIIRRHPGFIASVSRKIHECTKCTYKTVSTSHLKEHIFAKHPDIAVNREISRCIYCHKTFVRKEALDDHVVKRHPDFIASVSRKVHECTKCTFKTISSNNLKEHILAKHPDIAGHRVTSTCIYCNKTFVRKETLDDHIEHILAKHRDIPNNLITKRCVYCSKVFVGSESLDDHIVKRHPHFIASVSRKIHGCTKCTYKTVSTKLFKEHITVNHPDQIVVCIHCTEPFKSITMLDEHIIKKHPSSIPSITRKIHKCTTCDFSTTIHTEFKRHQLKHTDTYINRKSNICVHCNKSFLSKSLLDDHIVKKHPSFICSVTSKIRECTKCSYKTTIAGDLKKHMVQHPDVGDNEIFNRHTCIHCNTAFETHDSLNEHKIKKHPQFIASMTRKVHVCTKRRTCSHCNAAFTKQEFLNEHILQIHPQFTASISRKIHKCTTCDFNTTILTEFKRHQLKHTDRNSNICVHCNKSFLNKTLLDDHIVKKHPSFIYSVTSKIRECTKCSYKTTIAGYLKRHMKHMVQQHPDVGDNEIFNRCVCCGKTFIHKQALDEHIIKNHPGYISSVTSKIHECIKCNFKTTVKRSIRGHICQNVVVTAQHVHTAMQRLQGKNFLMNIYYRYIPSSLHQSPRNFCYVRSAHSKLLLVEIFKGIYWNILKQLSIISSVYVYIAMNHSKV
nr:unnamed protein product [Callosobruchus analis]